MSLASQAAPIPSTQPAHAPAPVDSSTYQTTARLHMPAAITGMAFTALTPSSHELTVDAGASAGGGAAGPEPLELLLVALGTCTGMDVISILRKKRQTVTHYSINVHANIAQEHPRTYTEILVEHIVGGESVDPRAVARAIELSTTRYCPVHALLSKATKVEHTYTVLDGPPGNPASPPHA